jgi:hypothetical protein
MVPGRDRRRWGGVWVGEVGRGVAGDVDDGGDGVGGSSQTGVKFSTIREAMGWWVFGCSVVSNDGGAGAATLS